MAETMRDPPAVVIPPLGCAVRHVAVPVVMVALVACPGAVHHVAAPVGAPVLPGAICEGAAQGEGWVGKGEAQGEGAA